MKTPYDTGKVKIGLLYQEHPSKYYNADQDWIQNVLLGERRHYMTTWYSDLVSLFYFLFSIVCLLGTTAYGWIIYKAANYD
jgi:hypothetical protein